MSNNNKYNTSDEASSVFVPGYNSAYNPRYDYRYVPSYEEEYDHYIYKKMADYGKTESTLKTITVFVLFIVILWLINRFIVPVFYRYNSSVIGRIIDMKCGVVPDDTTRMYLRRGCTLFIEYEINGITYKNTVRVPHPTQNIQITVYYNNNDHNDITVIKPNPEAITTVLSCLSCIGFIYCCIRVVIIRTDRSYAAANGIFSTIHGIKSSI